ncbi:hypothetical protein ACQ4LE_007158 [Meloidogyne hapla]|uniref:Uncharacterized protein n=1 Tax=Meloidogyne hapla TaxID=6305 RepID=A0A1I8BQR6_MELHA
MSKRKIEDDKSTQNFWEKFKIDSKGFLLDIHIKQQKEEDEKNKQKLFEIYQGSREEKLTLLPTASGEPTPGINGFRSILLQGMRDWESGIENITDFISKISTLSPKGISSEEEAEHKLCLKIDLPFAFKGNQESNFAKNLSTLLSIPNLAKSVGSFSYSEGGSLVDLLNRFPLLEPNPELFYRYDCYVYCENDVLVENYFSDIERWLTSQWTKPPTQNNLNFVRQARLKFVVDREDTAQQIISLLKEKFETATNPCTFSLRLDCPGFSLQPFSVENTNSGEFMAMELKNEYTIKSDQNIDDFEEEIEIEPLTKKKPEGRNGAEEGEGDSNSSSTSVLVWKSYKLVRASNANILGHLMKGHLPLLKRKLILN